jgi:hypothetical protein
MVQARMVAEQQRITIIAQADAQISAAQVQANAKIQYERDKNTQIEREMRTLQRAYQEKLSELAQGFESVGTIFDSLQASKSWAFARMLRRLAVALRLAPGSLLDKDVSLWRASLPSASRVHIDRSVRGSQVTFNNSKPEVAQRANDLGDLLRRHDQDFIRCSYITLLGRHADPVGEAHYLDQLREGVSKFRILRDLRLSKEGLVHNPGIAGLDRAIRRFRTANLPVIGIVVRCLTGREGDGSIERRLRIVNNAIGMLSTKKG